MTATIFFQPNLMPKAATLLWPSFVGCRVSNAGLNSTSSLGGHFGDLNSGSENYLDSSKRQERFNDRRHHIFSHNLSFSGVLQA